MRLLSKLPQQQQEEENNPSEFYSPVGHWTGVKIDDIKGKNNTQQQFQTVGKGGDFCWRLGYVQQAVDKST